MLSTATVLVMAVADLGQATQSRPETAPVFQQSGSGGFGGIGGGGNFGNDMFSLPEGASVAKSKNCVIVIPAEGKRLFAYSMPKGRWSSVEMKGDRSEKIVPILGSDSAAVINGQTVYAYSPAGGQWDLIVVREGEIPRPAVSQYIQMQIGSQLFLFGGEAARWGGVDLKTGQEAPINRD